MLQASWPKYRAEIKKWRCDREARLKGENGWLTVVGLFWLREGRNTVGTNPGSDVMLPPGSAPGITGAFHFRNGAVVFEAASGAPAMLNDRLVTRAAMKSDASGSPDLLRVNDLTMFVIKRGKRFGIRLRDKNSAARKAFDGLKHFPIRERYRVKAKFVPYHPPKKIAVPNILGSVEEAASPGYVEFTLDGRRYRLDPLVEGEELFFIFQDLTAAKETYPAGRFLYTPMPKNGEVILDFNRAINPPCAFTPYATCPLPPQQNHLAVRIPAGELRYGH